MVQHLLLQFQVMLYFLIVAEMLMNELTDKVLCTILHNLQNLQM